MKGFKGIIDVVSNDIWLISDMSHSHRYPYLYVNYACLYVCLYPINVKTAEPIRPKFCVWPHVTPGRFMNDQNFQNLCFKVLYFCKILKSAKKYNKIRNFLFCFILYKEKMLTDKATIKGCKMDAKRPKSPVTYIWVTIKETVKFVNGWGCQYKLIVVF